MSNRMNNTLQLIAPIQVQLKSTIEINLVEYHKDDIVTLEKENAIALVRKGKATALNDGVVQARSANMFKTKAKLQAPRAEDTPDKAEDSPKSKDSK